MQQYLQEKGVDVKSCIKYGDYKCAVHDITKCRYIVGRQNHAGISSNFYGIFVSSVATKQTSTRNRFFALAISARRIMRGSTDFHLFSTFRCWPGDNNRSHQVLIQPLNTEYGWPRERTRIKTCMTSPLDICGSCRPKNHFWIRILKNWVELTFGKWSNGTIDEHNK